MKRLSNKRLLVVGASSGIGRALALAAAREGARVAVAARRTEQLEQLAAEIDGGALSVSCDVRDPEACSAAVGRCAEGLGGLDALVYATGLASLRRVEDADHELWLETLEVNVLGASLITRAALPHLQESAGKAIYVSSIAADDNPPRPGLGLYIVAKTALNKLIQVWQAEHHEVSFTRVSVGDTGPTDLAAGWDPAAVQAVVQEWANGGYLFGRAMAPEDVAGHLVDLLANPEIVVESRMVPRFQE